MVQELQEQQTPPSVPEELYNLTQLAEVTLIAGKLRTTDINDIKNYIKGDRPTEPAYYYNLQPAHCHNNTHYRHPVIRPIPLNYDHSTDSDYDKFGYESAKKKWKTDWETENDESYKLQYYSNENNTQNSPLSLSTSSPPITNSTSSALSYLLLSSPSASTSSDDDSSKSVSSYSHKKFAFKKQLTFKQIGTDSDSLPSDQDHGSRPAISIEAPKEPVQLNYCDNTLNLSLNFAHSDSSFNVTQKNFSPRGEDSNNFSYEDSSETSTFKDCASESNLSPINKINGIEDCHACPECGKRYSTSSNLARHRQTHRSLHDKKARRCEICDKVYVSMPAYSMHIRTHNQGCQCPHCGKCFSRPWLLQGHIRTHTGERPFQCNQCPKAFADKSNLRAHIQTHSTTKNHKCTSCGKSFALKSYLYKHEESSCMKNRSKAENKIKNRKTSIKSKKHENLSNENKPSEQTLEMTLKNRAKTTSLFVKEKIKEILEDGHKKTYITLKNSLPSDRFSHNNIQANPPFVENRISVIKSVSSVTFEHPMQYDDPRKLAVNPTNNFEINGSYSIIA